MFTEKEENEIVSSNYCCPYLAKAHQQILLYPSMDKEKLVYTVSKFSFSNGPNSICNKCGRFLIYFYSVVLRGKGKTIPISLKLPEGWGWRKIKKIGT